MTRLLIAGLCSLALIIQELYNAPEGYEDEDGFHILRSPAIVAVRPLVSDNGAFRRMRFGNPGPLS
jgi:hypothetical protein